MGLQVLHHQQTKKTQLFNAMQSKCKTAVPGSSFVDNRSPDNLTISGLHRASGVKYQTSSTTVDLDLESSAFSVAINI